MTRDEILRMAREAGGLDLLCAHNGFTDTLIHFAALVAAAEREACAKLFDEFSAHSWAKDDAVESVIYEECAAAIRARGQA